MRKTRFLALALVVAIMLMGAGYAGWTDYFDTTTTIDTGELAVDLVTGEDAYMDIYLLEKGNGDPDNINNIRDNGVDFFEYVGDESEYYNISCTATPIPAEKKLIFTFTDIFPGVLAGTSFELANTGTVPAAVQTVTFSAERNTNNAELYDALEGDMRFILKHQDGSETQLFETGWHGLAALGDIIKDKLEGTVIQPGDILTTKDISGFNQVWFNLGKDSLDGDEGENQSVEINMDFDFVQSNLYETPQP
jgi:hypothetical protein